MKMMEFADGKTFFYEYRESINDKYEQMATNHYHRLFEIYFFEDGECNYFIDGKTFTLLPGDLIIIPSNVIHRTVYKSSYQRKLLHFSCDFLPQSIIDTLPTMFYLYRNPNIVNQVEKIFNSIEKEYCSPDKYTEDALTSLVYSLLFLLARNENTAKQKSGSSDFVAKSIKAISEDYQSDITLSSLADTFSISPEHLSRTFKKETGFGINEYLTLIRLRKAEQLLLEDNSQSISQIAYDCGFNDSNYFSNKFKKTYGISPLKFKQSNKVQKHDNKNI